MSGQPLIDDGYLEIRSGYLGRTEIWLDADGAAGAGTASKAFILNGVSPDQLTVASDLDLGEGTSAQDVELTGSNSNDLLAGGGDDLALGTDIWLG